MKEQPVRVDLHAHSTASDGTLSPAELADTASKRGLSILGLTDHDTTAGFAAAIEAAGPLGLIVIPGVELSTDVEQGEIHILGYAIEPDNAELQRVLTRLRESRAHRMERILDRLDELGISLSPDSVRRYSSGGSVGRPHIARAMIDAGIVSSVNQAFGEYLGAGAPAYVSRESLPPAEAVALIREAGGLPVFAHPLSYPEFRGRLSELIAAGLAGIEVYYGEYAPADRQELARVAETHNLLATGGSDYHGPDFKEGRDLGSVEIPAPAVEHFLTAIGYR